MIQGQLRRNLLKFGNPIFPFSASVYCLTNVRFKSQQCTKMTVGASFKLKPLPSPKLNLVTPFHCLNCYSTAAKSKTKPKDLSALESLNPEEVAKIIKIVNEVQRSEDLLQYFIPKKRAEKLIRRKNNGGEATVLSIEDIIEIVGPKVRPEGGNSSKFFCSLLDKPIPVSTTNAMFPVVSMDKLQEISNVLSLVIVGDKISWVLIERSLDNQSLNVKSMEQIVYPFKPRMHFLVLLQEMRKVVDQIPQCDLCIFEEYPATVPTPYMFTFQLQMAQARSTLLGIISSRPKPPVITSIKTVAVARLFNTFVGNEKVSGQQLVEKYLFNEPIASLSADNVVLDFYENVELEVRESLSQAFLLNLAYWKLSKQINIE